MLRSPELSLTVPIVNTLAFLFTVIGDWWVDGKVISRSESSAQAPTLEKNQTSHEANIDPDTMAGYYFSFLHYNLACRLTASTGHFMPLTPNALATKVIHSATFWFTGRVFSWHGCIPTCSQHNTPCHPFSVIYRCREARFY